MQNDLGKQADKAQLRVVADAARRLIWRDGAKVERILSDKDPTGPGVGLPAKGGTEAPHARTGDLAGAFGDLGTFVPRAVSASIRQVLGREAEVVASPGTYDQKHIVRIGKLEDCVAYGPGILDLAHQPDEYVEIDALVASAKVMALTVLRLQGAL